MPKFATVRRFGRREHGNMTVMGLFFFLSSLMAGSLALDFANKAAAERDLQIIADVAAHAALSTRLVADEPEAMDAALEIAQRNAAEGRPSGITAQTIAFGHWDSETRTFTAVPGARDAVRVTAHRDRAHDNMVQGLLMTVLGFAGFEIETESVFVAETHPCAVNGITAEFEIRFTSGNQFAKEFCLRSDRNITFSMDNRFGDRAVVSLPRAENLSLPAGRIEAQPGLDLALTYDPRDRLDMREIFRSFDAGFRAGAPNYIPAAVQFSMDNIVDVSGRHAVTPATILPGRTYVFYCGGSGTLAFDDGLFADAAIWTDCRVTFSARSRLEGVTLLQDNPDEMAIRAPAGVQLGANDGCQDGGETRLITSGGVHIAANLQMYEATIAAVGPVQFAANPTGMRGVAILSGQSVRGTSSGSFGQCDSDRYLDWRRLVMVR